MSDVAILYASKKDAEQVGAIVRQHGIEPAVLPMHAAAHTLAAYDALILVGDHKSVYDVKSAKCEPAAFKLGSPVLALGNAALLMTLACGGKVHKAEAQPSEGVGMRLKQSPLFQGLGREESVRLPPLDHCSETAPGCVAIASVGSQIGAIAHKKDKVFGVVALPSEQQKVGQIVVNFLRIADVIKKDTDTGVLKHKKAVDTQAISKDVVEIAKRNEFRAAVLPCLTRYGGAIAVLSGKGHYPTLQKTAVQMIAATDIERVLYVFDNDLDHPKKSSFSSQTLNSLYAHANLTLQVLLDNTKTKNIDCSLVVLPITTNEKPAVVIRPSLEKKGKKVAASFADLTVVLLKEIVQRMKQRGFGAVLYDLTPITDSSAEW